MKIGIVGGGQVNATAAYPMTMSGADPEILARAVSSWLR